MNIQKEINKTAANLGMVPGSEKRFDFDGMKFEPSGDIEGYEYYIVDVVTLKEGKSGNTRLRLYGREKDMFHEKEIHREIATCELKPESIIYILETISK